MVSLLSIITTIFVFIKNNRKLIIFIFKSQGFEKGPWYNGLTTTFRRYVVSYGCGYFILHIFVPIVYYIDGPIQAGKIGLLINIIKAVTNLSSVFIDSCLPKLNKLAFKKMHKEFLKNYKKSHICNFILSICIVFYNNYNHKCSKDKYYFR